MFLYPTKTLNAVCIILAVMLFALGIRYLIEYRKKNKFKTIEDIKNVSGIGDKKFESIKKDIEVKDSKK